MAIPAELAEDQLDVVWAALAAKRRAWAHEVLPHGNDDFITSVLGGAWTARHKGTAADCVIGQAKGAAVAWCKAFTLSQISSYSFQKYIEGIASALAL